MALSCDRCHCLGFPSELNHYPDVALRKRHALLHLEVDLGVGGEVHLMQQLLKRLLEDCFGSEKQKETLLKIPCPFCSFFSVNEKQLIDHLRSIHMQPKQTTCEICEGQYRKDLVIHLISHIRKRPHCGKDFKHQKWRCEKKEISKQVEKSKNDMETKDHIRSCATCGKTFQLRRALLQHEKWFHERPEECELCGLRFHSQKALNHHRTDKHLDGRKTHQPYELVLIDNRRQEAWRCLRCGFLDYYPALADAHQLTHSTDPDKSQGEPHAGTDSQKGFLIHCIKCDFSAPDEGNLKMHLRLVHLKGVEIKCDLCGKEFKSLNSLADHLLTHSSYHPFKCACGLTFKTKHSFTRHLSSCAEYICTNNSPVAAKNQNFPLLKYSTEIGSTWPHIRSVDPNSSQKKPGIEMKSKRSFQLQNCALCDKLCPSNNQSEHVKQHVQGFLAGKAESPVAGKPFEEVCLAIRLVCFPNTPTWLSKRHKKNEVNEAPESSSTQDQRSAGLVSSEIWLPGDQQGVEEEGSALLKMVSFVEAFPEVTNQQLDQEAQSVSTTSHNCSSVVATKSVFSRSELRFRY